MRLISVVVCSGAVRSGKLARLSASFANLPPLQAAYPNIILQRSLKDNG